MMNDSYEILNSILSDWFRWAKGYQYASGINTSPMFRECKGGRAWDTLDEIIDSDLENSRMEAVDHIIMSMCAVYRTALGVQARNLHTGRSVWSSARLPQDMAERQQILAEARQALTMKLRDGGIL